MEKDKKPTIVFLTTTWTNVDKNVREGKAPGGVPSISRIWTTCLKHGWDVHVFIETRTEQGWPDDTVEMDGVHFHWIRPAFSRFTKWLSDRKLYGWFKIFWLISQIRMANRLRKSKVKPDIIYCMRSTFAVFGYCYAKLRKNKIVLREYGTFVYDAWFEGKSWRERLRTIGPLLLFKIPFDLFIMTNDGTQGDKVAMRVGFNMERFWFPINGVNKGLRLPGFNKTEFKEKIGIPGDDMMLMTLGRLTYWKRLDRIIGAMPDILKEFPKAKLIIVGSGESKDELERQVASLGLVESVKFVGAVTHEEIKYYLNTTDIFVMPNDVTNMCSTLIEALSAGCCVITRDVGSTTEVVTNEKNAIVLDKHKSEAHDFACAIIEMLKNPDKIERLKNAAACDAVNRFCTWDERMEKEFEKLTSLIG